MTMLGELVIPIEVWTGILLGIFGAFTMIVFSKHTPRIQRQFPIEPVPGEEEMFKRIYGPLGNDFIGNPRVTITNSTINGKKVPDQIKGVVQ